ncbi:SETMAR [Cordylochernes scorpioides]|uniref:SETMAR n=1 Tax=Cordylochernes scorpioides TaxID=51811 RepID=A0ABY6LXU5_9ARAC|nr:SETMAR [Cordylochernes scorpioides]
MSDGREVMFILEQSMDRGTFTQSLKKSSSAEANNRGAIRIRIAAFSMVPEKKLRINIQTMRVWGKGAISAERNTRRWFEKFRNSDTSPGEEEGRGCPSVVEDDYLKPIIETETNKTTRDIAEELNVNESIVVRHLKWVV